MSEEKKQEGRGEGHICFVYEESKEKMGAKYGKVNQYLCLGEWGSSHHDKMQSYRDKVSL